MTYNIHRWAGQDQRMDLDRLAAVIASAGADLVALNEVLDPVTIGGRVRHPLIELSERLGMVCRFGPSGWVDQGPGWHGPVGNALLSRYPLTDATNTLLPRPPGTKQRSLLSARLAAGPAKGLSAFVTHLDHAFEGTRLIQLQGLFCRIAQDQPHFVGGDFNTPGFSGPHARYLTPPVLRWMHQAGYEDAFRVVGRGSGRTYPAASPLVRIDYLFFPRRWASGLRSADTLSWKASLAASDHRPVVVEWAWPAQGSSHVRDEFSKAAAAPNASRYRLLAGLVTRWLGQPAVVAL